MKIGAKETVVAYAGQQYVENDTILRKYGKSYFLFSDPL